MPAFQRTLPQLFEDSAARYAANVMMWEKTGDRYEGTTYRDIQQLVHACGAGLVAMGIRRGDRVALISEGRNAWVIAELGILYAGAINVPLSVKIEEPSELRFRLGHSGCRMMFVSGAQVQKIRQVRQDLPELERVIVLDGPTRTEEGELSFAELLERGRTFLGASRAEFDTRWQTVAEHDPANICYTSGTTADPKGIILTHRNYTANVEQASALLPIPASYVSVLILPWDHAFAHTAGVYTLIRNGASMASVKLGKTPMETLKNVPAAIREARPTFLLSVPALAKNFQKSIEKGVREKGPRVERFFRHALDVAYTCNGVGWDRGRGATLARKLQYKLYDLLLFRKIRSGFGGRLRFFIGGGALLDLEVQRFFYAIGIPMLQGYGLTEATPIISANVPSRHKLGSSGSVVPGLDIRICDEAGTSLPVGTLGEIVVRGENVMAGYWRNEEATREALRDGWLYTGDLGHLDHDGFLYVLGRVKSLLIGHDGEKYSPEGIEEALVGKLRYIDQVMLYNNQSPYTVAFVVPNRDSLLKDLDGQGLSPRTESGLVAALRKIETDIARFQANGDLAGQFPTRWLPSAVAILGEGFTEQNHLLNSTLKMVRGQIVSRYRDRLDQLFTPQGRDICNPANRAVIERW
jgi:long-chain acyl-CoA synthetase